MRWLLRASAAGPAKAGKRACSFVCIVLALAQVLAFVHEGVVAHAVCAEHGEAIHTERARSAPLAGRPASADNGWKAGEDSAVSGAHAHEHCACMAERRERFALALVAVLFDVPAANPAPVASAHDEPFASGIATVLVAPKGSPPV